MSSTQSRRMGTGDRLLDILCKVCGDRSSGKHYGVFTCDGCSGFFKRSIHEHRVYDCKKKGKDRGSCPINKSLRNQCRACRLAKCLQVNMNRDAVQHERGPRKPKVHPNLRKEQLPQQSPIVTQLSPYCRSSLHSDRLRPAHRLARDQRFTPYPRPVPVPVSQKPPEDDSSPIPLTLPQSPTTTTLRQPSLLEVLIVVETCPELAWREDLQPDNETSTEQGEGDTVHSPPRPLQPCDPTWEETTAYLLFKSVKWVGRLPYFQTLSEHDRMLLLTRSWPQLFLLHLAQWSISWDISGWLASEQVRDRLPKDDRQELNTIQHVMCRFRQLAPDPGECGSMKTVALFMPETEGLEDIQAVENLQNYVQQMLAVYTPSRYPNDLGRVGSLMLLVGLLRAVSAKTVVDLFFLQTIGEASTSDVLVTIYKKYANENIAPSRSFLQNISLPAFRNSSDSSLCRAAA